MHAAQFAANGFTILPEIADSAQCDVLCQTASLPQPYSAGSRALLASPWCQDLARHLHQHPLLAQLLPAHFVAVQCTYFEKSSARNWLVSVHQDLSIPVAHKVNHPELRAWSAKEGCHFVQVPTPLLEQLVAVRLHLDDCHAEDGPLRVIPGSHRMGTVDAEAAVHAKNNASEVVCTAPRGSALVMRPLLLHASSKSTGTSQRRVLHFLWGPPDLPWGLQWQHAVA